MPAGSMPSLARGGKMSLSSFGAGSEWRDAVIDAGPIGEIARVFNLELAKGNVCDVRYCYRRSPCYEPDPAIEDLFENTQAPTQRPCPEDRDGYRRYLCADLCVLSSPQQGC